MKSFKNLRGFTLLELLIVVVILAILAGLALPQYFRTVGRSREAEGWENLAAIRGALSRYYAEFTSITTTLGNLDLDISKKLFDYTITTTTGYAFTASAVPQGTCGGCRTLSVNQDGARTP